MPHLYSKLAKDLLYHWMLLYRTSYTTVPILHVLPPGVFAQLLICMVFSEVVLCLCGQMMLTHHFPVIIILKIFMGMLLIVLQYNII